MRDLYFLMDQADELLSYLRGTSSAIKLLELAAAILMFVATWMIFVKAGEGGWKLLIPFYGEYTRFKISGAKGRYWASLIMSVVQIILLIVFLVGLVDNDTGEIALGLFGFLALTVANTVVVITVNFSMPGKFGLPGVFGLGLWLLPVIFLPILAFDKNIVYVGDKKKAAVQEAAPVTVPEA